MLRSNSSRRRHQRESSPHICVAASFASLLLLLSLFVLHSRLSSSPLRLPLPLRRSPSSDSSDLSNAAASPLLLLIDDADNDAFDGSAHDRIDVLDNDDHLVDDLTNPEDDADPDDTLATTTAVDGGGGCFWDHLLGVKRRAFGRRHGLDRRIEMEMEKTTSDGDPEDDDRRRKLLRSSFASDDLPVDGDMRAKMASIRGIEDALLVKGGTSGGSSLLRLREGWAKWFEAKGRFLRQDRMFGSSMEVLNPMNHPLLHDPDIPGGGTGLTRGDRLVRKAIWKELEGTKFPAVTRRGVERKALNVEKEVVVVGKKRRTSVAKEGEEVYADGKRWGYYPGIDPYLSFSEFVEKFLDDDDGSCELRVFMVWNSPPWMYGVRHQRGLESLLRQHKDACVLVFSETMELDFFRDFVKDGFKVAVAMPDLDELLKDTPVLAFTSVWGEWRRTRYYSIHYSEVIRLAALFKYGGIYLDSDIIVLKSLKPLENTIGMEGNLLENSTFNGAVMAFGKQSPFIMECMVELYSTYDDTSLRWNGAQLLDRAIKKLQSNNYSIKMLKIKDPAVFFPISSVNITRYFSAPTDDAERYQHDALLKQILNQSTTFHFWNSMTSALVPERGSLVERLLNNNCLYCLDVL